MPLKYIRALLKLALKAFAVISYYVVSMILTLREKRVF